MSDIWGVILEQRIRPSSTWQIGEQITLTAPYLRNIQNTNDSSALSQIADTFQSTQYNNTTDFYVRSGVLSHWFYILTNGESGTNDINDSYAVDGIGLDLAEELIVEAVFNNYLDGTTTYPAIRTAFINAAEAIFCENSLEVKAVIDAWYAVGVGTKSQGVGVITGADTICASGTYSIPTSGATFYNWSVIAGSNIASITSGSSSVTLTQTGTNFGSVTIQATYGNSSCGSTTLTKEVYVGKPTVNIYRTYEWCEGKYHYITFEAYTNPANIQVNWSYFPPPGSNFYENGNTLQVELELPKNYQSNFFEIYATVTNPCGTTGVFYEDIVKKCGTFVNQPPFSAMVSPNPANSELNVFTTFTEEAEKETGNEVKELNYEIYDVYGALLYSNKHREASVKINTDNFKEGYYILILTYKEERVTKNFIIKH